MSGSERRPVPADRADRASFRVDPGRRGVLKQALVAAGFPAENPAKMARLRRLLEQHSHGRVLIMGEYIAQVEAIAKEIGVPLVTGKTPQCDRERAFARRSIMRGAAVLRSP